jgi:uncharacterized protein (TIGR02145 family)
MKSRKPIRHLSLFCFVLMFLIQNQLFAQSITNVQAEQKGDSILISYDLQGTKDPVIIQAYLSEDGGKSFSNNPLKALTGDIGEVKPGTNKKIYWNVLADEDYLQGNVSFRVKADSKYNYFTDKRDGKAYKTVAIGNQIWIAQNMNFFIDDKKNCNCYSKKDKNCEVYGRLYTYSVVKDVCPDGWHVPGKEEYDILIKHFANPGQAYLELLSSGSSGFNSLNAGFMDEDRESGGMEEFASYWTSTPVNQNAAWRFLVGGRRRNAAIDDAHVSYSFSVRCIKN